MSEVVGEHQMGCDCSLDRERAGGDTFNWACHWLNDRRSGLKYRSACDPCGVAEWVVPRRTGRFNHCGLGGLWYAAPSCGVGSDRISMGVLPGADCHDSTVDRDRRATLSQLQIAATLGDVPEERSHDDRPT